MQQQWFETFFQSLAVEFWNRAVPPSATLADVVFLESALEVKPAARLLDVPCGNGRHSIELARRGYTMTGVDLSGDFRSQARRGAEKAGVAIDFRSGDMRSLPLEESELFDGAFCFGNSIGYLGRAELRAFLAGVASCLKQGARFAIETGCTAESVLPAFMKSRWMRAGDIVMLSEARYVPEESRLDVEYTFLQGGTAETRPTASFVFTVTELREQFAEAGFRLVSLQGGIHSEPFELGSPRLIAIFVRT